jgi:hypothetical protein
MKPRNPRRKAEPTEDPEKVLDKVLAEDEREGEGLLDQLIREREAEVERMRRRYRMSQLAELDSHAMRRLARAGKISADDVRLWREARREAERRARLAAGISVSAYLRGFTARLVYDEFGDIVGVAVQ